MAALDGRVALVTGAGRGIGRAIAQKLHREGASVVIADSGTGMNGEGADPTVGRDLALELGARAASFTESIASPSAAAAAVAFSAERFGAVDIVVNNAAILRDQFVFKADALSWDASIRTSLSAAFYVLMAATPLMREQAKAARGAKDGYGGGRIVNIVSTAGFYGNYGQSAYAAAKAGLLGLTRAVALDMARSNATCNAVAPFASTRVTEAIKPQSDAQARYKTNALKVPAEPIGDLVAWLCAPAQRNVSGQLFGVRAKEVFIFSQPRPVARATVGPHGLDATIAQHLAPHYLPLETDLDVFGTPPILD